VLVPHETAGSKYKTLRRSYF